MAQLAGMSTKAFEDYYFKVCNLDYAKMDKAMDHLKKLMDSLTLKEKIGQLVQLDGRFFGAEEVPTGPCAELGIEPWVAENAGSVLNVLGAEKVYDVQKRHLEHSRIRLLFMADIVYGYITSYPISLALACSWDMELVEECGKHTAYEASADGAHVTFSPMADARHTAQKMGL